MYTTPTGTSAVLSHTPTAFLQKPHFALILFLNGYHLFITKQSIIILVNRKQISTKLIAK